MLRHQLHIQLIIAFSAVLMPASLDTDWMTNTCYAQAMIGYDSVINARLGIPPEHALDLAVFANDTHPNEASYSTTLLTTILAAYLWNDSPHEYSTRVYHQCSQTEKKVNWITDAVDT